MRKTAIFAGAAAIALSGAALAQPNQERPERGADVTRAEALQRADRMFDLLDANDDGRVTREEAQQAHRERRERRMERRFERLDIDNNGAVTLAEIREAQSRLRNVREAAGERRGGHGHAMRGMRAARMFGEQGFVTAEQFRARAAERFDRLDADDDGTVTRAERRQGRSEMRERHGGRR